VWGYVHNGSPRDLYCSVLDLTDRFRCHSDLLPTTLVPAGRTAVAMDGQPIDVSIPESRLGHPGSHVVDWLKVIASQERFDAQAFELNTIDEPLSSRSTTRQARSVSVLDRLGDRVVFRDAGANRVPRAPEWTTQLITVMTHGPEV